MNLPATLIVSAFAAVPLWASATVVNTLPWNAGNSSTQSAARNNSPEWTVVVFPGTAMSRDAASDPGPLTMTTANVRGLWFGYNTSTLDYAPYAPTWSPGTSAQGNYLSLGASFSGNAADWHAYTIDGSHVAMFSFRPTGCNPNTAVNPAGCYGVNGLAGIHYYVPSASNPAVSENRFHAIADMTQQHSFEWLLKGGDVWYRVDGVVVYGGAAASSGVTTSRSLLIGDSSGSSYSGRGSMTVHGVSIDTAPAATSLVSTVPEPGSWALLGGGLAVVGAAAARRRAAAA